MGAHHRIVVVIAITAAALGGCRRKEEAAPSAASSTARPPADHRAKGEILEGKERAFTLPLPLESTVKARFSTSVHVASPHTVEDLANFVRARVKDGTITAGASETDFDRVVAAKDGSKTLAIQIRPAAIADEFKSQMVVSDITAPPEAPGTTDEDRWRKAGMTPDGKLIDPKKLQ